MKTLINKQNPAIRITAPEIDVHEEEQMYLIPVSDYCIPMCIDDWTLVEEEPEVELEEFTEKMDAWKASEEQMKALLNAEGLLRKYRHIAIASKLAELYEELKKLGVKEEPVKEEIYPKCVHSGKDDGYCYYPYGGMRRRINENGVCECTGFCEKGQEQPDVELKKEIDKFIDGFGHKARKEE